MKDQVDCSSTPGEGWNYYGSSFLNRLNTLPVVQSTIQTTWGIYSSSKEKNVLIGKGLGCIEYGVTLASKPVVKVANTITEKFPVASKTVTKLDNLACSALETLENRVPMIQKEPGVIITDVKTGTSSAVQGGVRNVMTSFPGKHAVRGLDAMIEWSEITLAKYEGQKQKEAEDFSKEATEENKEKKTAPPTLTLKNGVVVPVKLYLQVLKMVKHMLANMAGVTTKSDVNRRKKMTTSNQSDQPNLVSRLTYSVLLMLGLWKQNKTEGDTTDPDERKKLDDLAEVDEELYNNIRYSLNLAAALDNVDEGSESVSSDDESERVKVQLTE